MGRRAHSALAGAATLVGFTAACGGSGEDKAGGAKDGETLVLRLATHDDRYAQDEFAAAVERLSGGFVTVADYAFDERAHGLTSNVVLWPLIQAVFMNRAAFEALTPSQRRVLLRAGREALGSTLADIEKEEAGALATICERGNLGVTASAGDLARLRQAVQPVYDGLERDPATRTLIARIAALRRGTSGPGPELRCEGEGRRSAASAALEGRWR